jgi:CRISPR-associated endonuclease/helicase Cas3
VATELTPADFDAFFTELWGFAPYRWQSQMLHWIHTHRRFPDVVPVRTGGGKTSMLEISLFALALDSQRPHAERWAPRRIVMVQRITNRHRAQSRTTDLGTWTGSNVALVVI